MRTCPDVPSPQEVASLILAAGRGSRMTGFEGNKTLLPLIPQDSPFRGDRPILLHILESLPQGPKAVVVCHDKEAVMAATQDLGLHYVEQPRLNGTGGALLAALPFLERLSCSRLLITMGDVPLVRPQTYARLARGLEKATFVLLAFSPRDRRQYGLLDLSPQGEVRRIVEWAHWRRYPPQELERLRLCNAGIYAARLKGLLRYLPLLAQRPHRVRKERGGRWEDIEEFFLTDLVAWMAADGLSVRYETAPEEEVMGVDDPGALRRAQALYAAQYG